MDNLKEIFYAEHASLYASLCYNVELNNTYEFAVKSGSFSGKSTFCIHLNDLMKILNNLKDLNTKLSGDCTITDTESINYLKIYFNEYNLYIEGLFSDFGEHTLKFKFMADQTILLKLIEILE